MQDTSFREAVAEVLTAVDIVDVAGSYLELKPAGGSRFKALCPFHTEKTPSFTVTRDRQTFYCFGCEKHGDAITFVQEHEGLTFKEALQRLADRGGVRLPEFRGSSSEGERLRGGLFDLSKFAAKAFRENLEDPKGGAGARAYLETRGLRDETITRFGLGFARDSWDALRDRARKEGFDEKTLMASGLVKPNDKGGVYDFFRNRLMFPIRDVSEKIVAFGGRDLGDGPAKYINSPENANYKKGRILYGLCEARDAMRREKKALLVEGYFDLLRCFDVGIENAAATCGTALTPAQAALIHRYAREVLLVFDGDAAGVRAALRGVGVLTAAGLSVRAVVLPGGQDPDDFIREQGREAFQKLLDDAPDFVRFFVNVNAERTRGIEGRTEVARELFAMFVEIEDQMRRDEYVKLLARELEMEPHLCRVEFSKFERDRGRRARPATETPRPRVRVNRHDLDFVSVLMKDEDLLRKTQEALASVELLPGVLREVLDTLFEGRQEEALARLESEEARDLYSAAANLEYSGDEETEILVKKHLTHIRQEALRREALEIQEEIENAQRLNDGARVNELVLKRLTVQQEIQRVGAA